MIIEIKRIMKTRLRLGAILHFIIAIGHIGLQVLLARQDDKQDWRRGIGHWWLVGHRKLCPARWAVE